MLEIITKENEFYHSESNKLITIPPCVITLEHSLISIAKWESKWHIPYLSDEKRTSAQELDYIRCMIINNVKNEHVINALSKENLKQIEEYINNPMTASTFSKIEKNRFKKRIITAESLYYRMFANGIPIECQKWHLNRLIALMQTFDVHNSPNKKMSNKQTAQWNANQNALRRAKYNTKG